MAAVRGEDLPVSHELREVSSNNKQDMATVARLHMELLDYGPMAGLGELFIRQVGYSIHLRDGLLKVALYEVAGRPAGFVAYTSRSITFHRSGLGKHWLYVMWILTISMLQDPRRLRRLLRAIRVIRSRRAEGNLGQDPLGEIVAIAVLPQYRKPEFTRRTGLRLAQELVAHARSRLKQAGVTKMRMVVDDDNKAALFFYHGLGAQLEPYEQAGEPKVQVWFELNE